MDTFSTDLHPDLMTALSAQVPHGAHEDRFPQLPVPRPPARPAHPVAAGAPRHRESRRDVQGVTVYTTEVVVCFYILG